MRDREFKDAIFAEVARVAGAFSSAKRLEIIDLLAQGERSVESIAIGISASVGNTSRHLQILRAAGLVATRRDGVNVIYRLADPSVFDGYRMLVELSETHITQVTALAQAFFADIDGAEAIGLDELGERTKSGEIIVVDVRPRPEFEAGHLAGAINIPLDELADRIATLPSESDVVAYCRGPYCVLAAHAVAQLRAAGFRAVRLSAGPRDWRTGDRSPVPEAVRWVDTD